MIEFIKNWTARDWLSFILQLIGAGVVVVFIWAAIWVGCALNDKCYCDNTVGDEICQTLK
jgi:hypothetical protein|tara:strand:+ start:3072 stop:3251 length:180 start_codon:yes stop_codon:yes gene_type:complete